MPATEPLQAGPYPEPSDPPDGPNQLAALAVWAAGRLNMRFASPAARDAAITSPVEDMIAITGTGATQVVWVYRSAGWCVMGIGPWIAYTPALTAGAGSWVLGTGGVNNCVWRREGDLARVRFQFRLGTGFTFPTVDPKFTLPVAAEALPHSYMVYNGLGSALSTGSRQDLLNILAAGTSTTIALISAGANPTGSVPITPTSPFTWTAGADMAGEFTYRPA